MATEPRVIHLIKATGIAGAERHLLDLLPQLRARGCDAHLWVLTEPRRPVVEFLDEARARGIPTESLTIRADLDLALLVRLVRRFRQTRPDMVHTHLVHADVLGGLAAHWAGVHAVVTTRHNDDAFRRLLPFRALNGWLWRRVDAGIAVSSSVERFSREIEFARAPIQVIHHGVASVARSDRGNARDALGIPSDAVVIGLACRLTKQKGVTHALQAFAMVSAAYPQAILLVAGDGPERRKLESQAARSDGRERVRFLGWQADSGPVLSALDVLMAPSLWEGFGMVLLEGMARGVPILATTAGAIPEIVADGETGLLVPPGDAAALAAALDRLLGDAALRARLGAAGAERAQRDFGLSRMAEETLASYAKVLAR